MFESAKCLNIVQRVQKECSPIWIEIYHKTGGTQIHKDHSACTKATCFANDLRTSNILPEHTSPGCSCPLRGAEFCQLQRTLQSHDVALIRLDEIDGKIAITVEPMDKNRKHFAISHALADGLCNMERNELPECQLRRILKSVKSAMSNQRLSQDIPVYVWIDTMCLPPRDSRSNGVAISTFQTIQAVMRNALAVVVLDTDIAVLSRTSSYAERCLKISFSSWASRLWTLLEAIIAQKLLFECRDGIMDLEDVLECSSSATTMEDALSWRPLLYASLGTSGKRHTDDRYLLEHALKWARTSAESDSILLKSAIRLLFDFPSVDLDAFVCFLKSQQRLKRKTIV